jgi:hypothetical protein
VSSKGKQVAGMKRTEEERSEGKGRGDQMHLDEMELHVFPDTQHTQHSRSLALEEGPYVTLYSLASPHVPYYVECWHLQSRDTDQGTGKGGETGDTGKEEYGTVEGQGRRRAREYEGTEESD